MSDAFEDTKRATERLQRREARLRVRWKVAVEKLAEREQKLPPALAQVYERVIAEQSGVGQRHQMVLRDVSMNGAFVEGEPLPLLSRVAIVFEVPHFRKVEAVGWVMWRRTGPCSVPGTDGRPVELGAGFGVLFEWVSLEARLEFARRIALGQPE
jgi:hypothetical protein